MAKRFIDTSIWTQNKWFRKLSLEDKLLWIYLFTNCDSVGVWEEDIELASFIIGYTYSIDSLLKFDGKLKKINSKKYWIVDFCDFQYGTLKEENIKNKPHQSYIKLLKNHSLWKDYVETIYSLKEKEKDKDKELEEEKEINLTELTESIIRFISEKFGFNEVNHFPNYKLIVNCVICQQNVSDTHFKHFKDQCENYFLYKDKSEENKHSFIKFIGTPESKYLDGGWNAENWSKKNLEFKENKTKNSNQTHITHDTDF